MKIKYIRDIMTVNFSFKGINNNNNNNNSNNNNNNNNKPR
jgi:hypothetical protein